MSSSQQISSFDGGYDEISKQIHEGFKGRIVFTNGCFDLLHPGHLDTLSQANELAGPKGKVVVGINSDESIRRLKGPGRPIMDAAARGRLLMSIRYVDHVVVFDEDTPAKLIEALRPNAIVKGGDYTPDKVVGKDVAPVFIAEMRSGWSTSKIVEKIRSGR